MDAIVSQRPRQAVWHALNNTEVLKACIPGCQRLDWTGDDTLELEIKVNLGLVKPVFKGDLQLSGIVPAERYTLSGKGKGGVLGLAQGAADIVLTDDGDGTELSFTARGGAVAAHHAVRQGPDRQLGPEDHRRLLRAIRRGDGRRGHPAPARLTVTIRAARLNRRRF